MACDEGLYLYPWKLLEMNSTIQDNFNLYPNHCVPDCPTVNRFTVNNPELGRCEFLGPYCTFGTYKEGCKVAPLMKGKIIFLYNN